MEEQGVQTDMWCKQCGDEMCYEEGALRCEQCECKSDNDSKDVCEIMSLFMMYACMHACMYGICVCHISRYVIVL